MRRSHIAFLVLVLVLSAPAWAQSAKSLLKKNSVTSKHVKNGSLKAKDFKQGVIERGPTGPMGPQGVAGTPDGYTKAEADAAFARGATTTFFKSGTMPNDTLEPVFDIPGLATIRVYCDSPGDSYGEVQVDVDDDKTADIWSRTNASSGFANDTGSISATAGFEALPTFAQLDALIVRSDEPGTSAHLVFGLDVSGSGPCSWAAEVEHSR